MSNCCESDRVVSQSSGAKLDSTKRSSTVEESLIITTGLEKEVDRK